ncbi:hypothetical protein [Spirosoma sp. 48-14]|uniref:hypothetical protein n=1 Tax=Spirosoma sp. 48-14 TaxID=1895854 RepID=UPI000968E94C|nr:hypothetical protein [Spirosoma sp. 48-14]OJW78436.1 MAG: hypothetical protein BGO59_31020 [Spirosoma sp. 48-14]
MDITVENIAGIEIPEDLQAAIFAKLEAKAPDYLTGKGFIVKPKTDYDNELSTYAEQAVTKAVGEESAKLYGSIDGLLAIALDEAKPDGMRTAVWVKQLQDAGKLPLSDEAMKAIRDKIKGSAATKDAVIDQLKEQLNTEKTARENDKVETVKQAVRSTVNADLRTAPVVIPGDLKDEAAKTAAKNTAIADLKEYFNTLYEGKRNDDGDIYFVKKGTDRPLMNAAENRPMTPTEIIRANHSMYLAPVSHKQEGGGTGKPDTGGQPGAFTSLTEIRVYAINKLGYAPNTPEFFKFIDEERKKAKL